MFIILLTFSDNKSQAKEFMDGHNTWIKRGFDEGVFLLAGSIQPSSGGAVVAHNVTYEALERMVGIDPFVVHNVVRAKILEISPGQTDERLSFLKTQ